MKRMALGTALCLLISSSLMAEDFGLICEKKHGNGKYIMYFVSSGYAAYVAKDNLFRGHVNSGSPQTVRKVKSTDTVLVYQKDHWAGADVYTVSKGGNYIRSESTVTKGQEKNEKFDERCRYLTDQESASFLLMVQLDLQIASDHPFGH